MRSVRVLEAAADEAVEAAFWYERQHSGLGVEFQQAVDVVLDFPEDGIVPYGFGYELRNQNECV